MSSIGEAKERIALASESADEARTAVTSASAAIADAIQALNEAASDSEHEKVAEALAAYREAAEKLEESMNLLGLARQAADEYSSQLG
jgi:hypothetical protein